MKLGRWSTTAANNNSVPPDGAPEGQAATTFNDCMREVMASVRTVFTDAQFVDQALTPTYATSTTFTVTGDQTSAIHAGRQLKIQDYTTIYATVVTASFTAVTTIQIETDSGSLTAALSSFALGIFSKNNNSIPIPSSISAASVHLPVTATCAGLNFTTGGYSQSKTAVDRAKAWVGFYISATTVVITSSYNIASVSRSGAGIYTINFTNPFADTNYTWVYGSAQFFRIGENPTVRATSSMEVSVRDWPAPPSTLTDPSKPVNLVFYR